MKYDIETMVGNVRATWPPIYTHRDRDETHKSIYTVKVCTAFHSIEQNVWELAFDFIFWQFFSASFCHINTQFSHFISDDVCYVECLFDSFRHQIEHPTNQSRHTIHNLIPNKMCSLLWCILIKSRILANEMHSTHADNLGNWHQTGQHKYNNRFL